MNKHSTTQIIAETREIYNKIAPQFSETRKFSWQGFEKIKKYVNDGDKIIDLGCGNGRTAKIFEDLNVDYLGIDNSEGLIKEAKKIIKNKNFDFEVGDITNLYLPKNKFNLALLVAVLHHIPSKDLQLAVLKNIHKTLKPGGRLVISNWNLWSWQYRKRYWKYLITSKRKDQPIIMSLKDAFIPWKLKNNWQWRFVHSFSKGELKSLLKKAGFTVEDIYYLNRGKKSGLFGGENLVAIAVKR